MQLNVVQQQFNALQANTKAAAASFQRGFATHLGLPRAHVTIESINPSIGEFDVATDFSLLKTGESDKDQTAAVMVHVTFHVLVAEKSDEASDFDGFWVEGASADAVCPLRDASPLSNPFSSGNILGDTTSEASSAR